MSTAEYSMTRYPKPGRNDHFLRYPRDHVPSLAPPVDYPAPSLDPLHPVETLAEETPSSLRPGLDRNDGMNPTYGWIRSTKRGCRKTSGEQRSEQRGSVRDESHVLSRRRNQRNRSSCYQVLFWHLCGWMMMRRWRRCWTRRVCRC